MKMPEFNQAIKAVDPALRKAQSTGSTEDICNLTIVLALHGLVLVPIKTVLIDSTILEPICYVTYMPETPVNKWDHVTMRPNCYLIPADQVSR